MSIYVNIVTFSLVIMITFVSCIMNSIFHFHFPVLLEHTNRYYQRGTFFNFQIVTTKIYLFIFIKNFDRQSGPSRFYLSTEEKSIILRQSTRPSSNDVLKASLKVPFIFSNIFFCIVVVVVVKHNFFKRVVKAFSQFFSEPFFLHLLQILFICSRNRAKKFKKKTSLNNESNESPS